MTQLRLIISEASALLYDETAAEIDCGSCEDVGLKIVPHGTAERSPGESLQLQLNFDVERSLVPTNGGFSLRPVILLSTSKEGPTE